MIGILRRRLFTAFPTCDRIPVPWNLGLLSTSSSVEPRGPLEIEEVKKILNDVKADDVRVINVGEQCGWTDYMVFATGRSTWHVKNIAQAILHKVKQKQKGVDRMLLPSVEGHVGGKWVVIDSGTVIIHALDEKARAYYNLESLWTNEIINKETSQDLEKAFVKVRPKNNSKRKPGKITK